MISWILLLGVPFVAFCIAVAALVGRIELDPMWTVLSVVLTIVFLHGVLCVWMDETKLK